MKVFKKLFVLLLLVFVGFSLAACDENGVYTGFSVEEYQAKIAELEAALAELTAGATSSSETISELTDKLAELEANVPGSSSSDLSALKTALLNAAPETTSLLWDEVYGKDGKLDLSLVFGDPEESVLDGEGKETNPLAGYYHIEAGTELDVTLSGVTVGDYDFSDYVTVSFDYFWSNTEDYNNGMEFDEETGKLSFRLPGVYGVLFYVEEAFPDVSSYAAASIGSDYGVQGSNKIYIPLVVDPGLSLVSSSNAAKLEIKAGATDQLKVVIRDLEGNATDPTGVTTSDYVSSNPAVATVSATGFVTALAVGSTTISVKATDADDKEKTLSLAVQVLPDINDDDLAGGSEGAYLDLSHSDYEQKTKILAHMERWLLNQGASIPVINNSGMSVYHERVNFLADSYVPLMGYGPMYVAPDTGTGAGTAADPAYRLYTTADPSTLNHLNYADSIESDFLTLLAGGLVELGWELDENGKGVGFEVQASMSAIPYPVSNENGTWTEVAEATPLTESKSWKFDLREDLAWQNGDPITADDFIFTYQQALSPTLNMRRANYYYGGSTPIAGAKDYFDGKSEWSSVGIEKVDDHSFVVTYTIDLVEWDVCYSWSSFLYSPVHRATWEACLNPSGTSTTYGTSIATYMACGPYKLSYWEKGKEYRFTKNDQFFAWDKEDTTVELVIPAYDNVSYTIVKDSNAALALFREGLLDVTGVPSAAYDEFSSNPNTKTSPGATSFRFSVNTATQAELDAEYGVDSWEAKPILQESDFRWALYYGLDRLNIQEITKVNTGFDAYFTDVYGIVSPTANDIQIGTYRTSEWGQKVFTGIWDDDAPLEASLAEDKTLNYNATLATNLYVAALDSMIAKGVISVGTEANPTRISIEIAAFDGTTWESVLEFVTQKYNELFNNTSKYGNRIVFEAVAAPQPGMDVYYVKQMTGQFDLALAGISGGTLDPMGFLECFCDDNRSGLFLNPGLDTHNASILIDLDLDGDGDLDGAKYWSFDALYSAYYQETYIKSGCEAEAPSDETAK